MFQLISDGACDFTREEAATHNVGIVPFYVSFGEAFLKENEDISKGDFFARLIADKKLFPTTAQPNPNDYIEICEPHLKAGSDVVILTVSSKLSGSNNSANVAADLMREDYPQAKIVVIDSLNGSVAQYLILKEMIKMRDAGLGVDEVQALTKSVIDTTHVYFTLDSLEYLKKGGRVGATTALIGGALGLRPVLQLEDGLVSQLDSVRGKKNVLRLIEAAMVHVLADVKDEVNIAIGHILSEKEATTFAGNLETTLQTRLMNPILEVGATIGAHAGPGALAFAYCKKYETLVGGNTHE